MKEKIHLKKKDWILILVIIVVAGLSFFLHNLLGAKGANCVVVKVDGKIEGTYSLGKDQEISINGGTNKLAIKYNRASMVEADCPDQLCVKQRSISKAHESIICLPNKVVVEVESAEGSTFDAISN
ncbi:MAG: NusG domain II-containing protein [Lachnospiraceae bacterium]|nr:NusG domain II-containing protein [Lachnospiraceae bacterium]